MPQYTSNNDLKRSFGVYGQDYLVNRTSAVQRPDWRLFGPRVWSVQSSDLSSLQILVCLFSTFLKVLS